MNTKSKQKYEEKYGAVMEILREITNRNAVDPFDQKQLPAVLLVAAQEMLKVADSNNPGRTISLIGDAINNMFAFDPENTKEPEPKWQTINKLLDELFLLPSAHLSRSIIIEAKIVVNQLTDSDYDHCTQQEKSLMDHWIRSTKNAVHHRCRDYPRTRFASSLALILLLRCIRARQRN